MTRQPLRVGEESSEADDELDIGDIILNRPFKRGGRDVSKRHSVDLSVATPTTSKFLSLPRSLTTSALTPNSSGSESKGQTSSKRKGKIKEEKKLKQSSVKKGAKARPLELPLSKSHDKKSHDRQPTKGSAFLPTVTKQATPPDSPRPHHRTRSTATHPHTSADNKLPLLNNMQVVAMVAVDTDQDRLKVQNYSENAPRPKHATPIKPIKTRPVHRAGPMGRSKSMMPLK